MKLGRTFNHLEDLVFFYGCAGAHEALLHLEEIAGEKHKTLRMKWDGSPQIYWGREVLNGPLIIATHTSWLKGVKSTSGSDIENFINYQSGNPKTQLEIADRAKFAKQFGELYELFDNATPKDFVGFVYADSMFLTRPSNVDGVYSFSPNVLSQTTYHVNALSNLGKKIAKANVMVVGHARFDDFGAKDNLQIPMDDFSMFNSESLIVQSPLYNTIPVCIDLEQVHYLKSFITTNIDKFLDKRPGLSDLRDIIYTYVNQSAKCSQLDLVSSDHFLVWLGLSKVSANKQSKIRDLHFKYLALDNIFMLVTGIMALKDSVINQIEYGDQMREDIWDTNGEGRVRYADSTKQFGHVKFVPRKRWIPN